MSVDPSTALPGRPSPGAAGVRLGELYAAHSRMVYGICRMLLRDPDEAEDATQQVFLAAYGNLLTGTDVREPAAWLGTIARNACRRRAASRMREPLALGDDQITLVSAGVEETAIGREEATALYAELGGLPEKQREAVVLRDLYGLRYDEVARALGTSRPAVEALLFRGRRRLQRRLRPKLAAGVLVVPLAVQESIAYAVPGFASAAAPAGASAVVAGIPLLAKLAAGGAAVTIAGSAAVVERSPQDPPPRPADLRDQTPPRLAAVVPLLPIDSLAAPFAKISRAAGESSRADDTGADRNDDDADDEARDGTAAESTDGIEGLEQTGSQQTDAHQTGSPDTAEPEQPERDQDADRPHAADVEEPIEPDEPDDSGSGEDDGSVGEE